MDEGGPHLAMMGCRMMFGMMVEQLGWCGMPKHLKLALLHTKFNPLKTHVDGFEAFMLDSFIVYTTSGGVVGLDRGYRLRVTHFLQGMVKGDGGLCIFEQGKKLCLSG